jgi:hypothetical protein
MSEAPSTPVDICNLALAHCGEDPIEDLDDAGDAEELCARWYDHERRKLLRQYMWNFAQRLTTLARTDDGAGDYDDMYLLPTDCLRLSHLGSSYEMEDKYDEFEITVEGEVDGQGGNKVVNVNNDGGTLYIKYTRDVTNITMWDPLFTDILALRLALQMAMPLTKKDSVVERIEKRLKVEEPKAVSVDGQERVPRRIQNSKYLKARQTGLSDAGFSQGYF